MKKWMRYENIWARNIIFGSLMFVMVYAQSKLTSAVPNVPISSDLELIIPFIQAFLSIFCYNHFVIRQLFFSKKYVLFGGATVVYIAFISLGRYYFEKKTQNEIFYIEQLISTFVSLFVGACIYTAHNWVSSNIVKTKIQLLDKEAEITFLKQQLSPHFLFNAINNLYGTALAAPEIIPDKLLELADLLRYQVGATTKNYVTIEEERAFVENYMNYVNYKSNDLKVTNISKGVIKPYKIPPLLFLPLIENAVKYAAETENPFIHIRWIFEDNALIFRIENSYLAEESTLQSTKVGLENLKKRLLLLNVKYQLSTDTYTLNIYKTELTLWELSINA